MKNAFGGRGIGGGDPFANDPFFSEPMGGMGMGFGNIDKMISKVQKNMQQSMMGGDGPSMRGMGGNGKFAQMQQITKTKADQYGNPITETYQTKAQGAIGGGNKITERHQMY